MLIHDRRGAKINFEIFKKSTFLVLFSMLLSTYSSSTWKHFLMTSWKFRCKNFFSVPQWLYNFCRMSNIPRITSIPNIMVGGRIEMILRKILVTSPSPIATRFGIRLFISKKAHMRAFKMIQRTHFEYQNNARMPSKGAPKRDRLQPRIFLLILQLLGRNNNKCCFLATNVAFYENSSLR